jgi:amino acid adenylation domain-containing protein/FkbM family methyltransferase
MTPIIGGLPDEGAASLPLRAARSAIFWPRRTMTTRRLRSAVEGAPAGSTRGRLGLLGAAVACVLYRYNPDCIAIGLAAEGDAVRLLRVTLGLGDRIGDIQDVIARAIGTDACALAPDAEPDTAFNADFAVLLAADRDVETLPERRQDINIAIDLSGTQLSCTYGSRLFDPEVVAAFLAHVEAFLEALASNRDRTLASLRYIDQEELDRIVAMSRSDDGVATPLEPVTALFDRVVATRPNAVALEAAGSALTYRDLDRRAGSIAAGLSAEGLAPGDFVALAAKPGIAQVAALIGILKAGMTPVPIDHSFPALRNAAILAIAAPKAVLTDGCLTGAAFDEWCFLEIARLSERRAAPAATVKVPLDSLVYLLFTSGSTGTPKGVLMPHRTLANLVRWQEKSSAGSGQRTLNRSSMAFDVGFQEIFSTLCFGHTLVVASQEERADVVGLAGLIERLRIDRIFIPPVSLIQMAEGFEENRTPLSSLRQVIVAGEAMRITQAIIRMFRACPVRVTNQYGPTETHVATSHDLAGSALRWPQLPPIGRPIANARAYVLDASGHLCPLGVKGEIAIGGIVPGLGYLGREDDSKRRFVTDPFNPENAGATMYMTGDLGRFGPDGNLEFLGRRDDQIKLRGYRVELGDVEANAMGLPGVKLAAAVLRERKETGPFIALFVEPAPGAELDVRSIREQIAARLPEHMVPSLGAIAIVDKLPLNSNGKVDRKGLPAVAQVKPAANESAGSSLGDRIEAIWRAHLNVAELRPDDDFIALGGHSLLAIRLVSLVNERFGVNVPVATLLQEGSLARFTEAVARQLDRGGRENEPSAGPPASRGSTLYEVRLADGETVRAPYPQEVHHFHREIVTRDVYFRHGIHLPENALVVDVGANIGLFARAVLSRSPTSRVIAIEPAPLSFAALRSNLAGYEARATLIELGLSDRGGARDFTFYPQVTGMSSFAPDPAADRALLGALVSNSRAADRQFDEALEGREMDYLDSRMASEHHVLPVERLSTLIRRLDLSRIELLKVDVQRGSEMVLDGIDPEDWPRIGQIVVEHQRTGPGRPGIEERLASLGYRVTTAQDDIHRNTDVVYTYAIRAG